MIMASRADDLETLEALNQGYLLVTIGEVR